MSSSTIATPTWFTGALVSVWMSRSAVVRPRNSHRSPVRVRSTAVANDTGATLMAPILPALRSPWAYRCGYGTAWQAMAQGPRGGRPRGGAGVRGTGGRGGGPGEAFGVGGDPGASAGPGGTNPGGRGCRGRHPGL